MQVIAVDPGAVLQLRTAVIRSRDRKVLFPATLLVLNYLGEHRYRGTETMGRQSTKRDRTRGLMIALPNQPETTA